MDTMKVFDTALMKIEGRGVYPRGSEHGFASYPTKIIEVECSASYYYPGRYSVKLPGQKTYTRAGEPVHKHGFLGWWRTKEGPCETARQGSPRYYEVTAFTQDWAELCRFLTYYEKQVQKLTTVSPFANQHFRSLVGSATPGSLCAAAAAFQPLLFQSTEGRGLGQSISAGFSEYMARLLAEFLRLAPDCLSPKQCFDLATLNLA